MVASAVKTFTPRPYQKLMFDFIARTPRCLVCVFMGAGKTSTILWNLTAFLLAGYSRRVLILAPLRVAKTTWPDEVKKWSLFSHLRIDYIGEWAPDERAFLQARGRLQRAVKNDPECKQHATKDLMTEVDRLQVAACKSLLARIRQLDVSTLNYDKVQELVDILGDKWPFDTVISDEVSKLKGTRTRQGSKRGRALADVMFLPVVQRFIGLTGTIVPNGLGDLWGPMYFVDQGARLGKSFTAFEARWFGFERKADAYNGKKFFAKRVLFPHSEAEINAAVADSCFTLDAREWFDVAEPIVNKIYIDLPPDARRQYAQLEKEMYTSVEGHAITAVSAATKSIKAQQFCSGSIYVNGSNEEFVEVHDEKLDALHSIVEENPGLPILVAVNFRSDFVRLERRFPHARRLDPDPRTIAQWNAGEIPLLLAHPASAGHGLNLAEGSNTLVFFSVDWNLENHLQVIERIGPVRQKQAGYDRPVFLHFILARNTVDETIMKRLTSKASVQQCFLEAMLEFNRKGTADADC